MKRIISYLLGVWLLVLISSPVSAQSESLLPDDTYLAGYLSAILERELGWEPQSYRLVIDNRIAVISLSQSDTTRLDEIEAVLMPLQGLYGLRIEVVVASDASFAPGTVVESVYSFLGISPDTAPFPTGDLFIPLIADPKQPRFSVSYRYYHYENGRSNIGAVSFGESFGFYRREGRRSGDGLQLSIAGSIFAQFDLDAPSKDLVNADYVIGLPLAYRHAPWSARLRFYHQSSHLGDEYLLRNNPERINLSFESLELLVSYDWQRWRPYGGAEYFVHRQPKSLDPAGVHGGIEYRGRGERYYAGRLVGGLDLKSWQQHNWAISSSLKVGLEFGDARSGERRMRILAEGYRGYAPHGQFYDTKLSYLGLGIYFGF